MTNDETASLIIKFIQQISYEIPEERKLGYSPPLEVLQKRKGDCDSKSVLGAILLNKIGYRYGIYLSAHYSHAMMGINIPSIGEYKTYEMEDFYFVEMTAPGWRIGDLPPDFSDINKWSFIPLF